MTDRPTHYVHSNGASIFVMTAEFFAAQGGLIQEWGRYWRPVSVPPSGDEGLDIEAARALGDAMFPVRGAYAGREIASARTHEQVAAPADSLTPEKLAEVRRNLDLGVDIAPRTIRAILATTIDELARLRAAPATGGGLTFADVSRVNLARCNRWHPGGIHDWSVADWACAMAGEAGEVCNAVKKLRRVEDETANVSEPDRQLATRAAAIAKIGEELADTFLYLNLLACRLDIDLAREVVGKFNATSERYGFPERLGPAPAATDDNGGHR